MNDRAIARDRDRIQHILDAADKLAEIVAEGREAFNASWRQRDVAERRLLIIGEAAGQLSPGLMAAHPSLDFAGAKRMRNVLVHAYDNVDDDLVWDAITLSVPALAEGLRDLPDFADLSGAGRSDLGV